MNIKASVTYDVVANAAAAMLQHNTKPTVRAIIAVTGGKTETVAQYLRDFHDKRNADVLRMADELGSSSIAKLLADEVQTVVDKRTATLKATIDDLTERLNETIELLSEKETDCQHRIELTQAQATQAIFDAEQRASAAEAKIADAESAAIDAKQQQIETEKNAERAIQAAKDHAALLVGNAQSEANALVKAADKRTDKAEIESASLREQVKALTIDEATRQIEKQHLLDALALKDSLKDEIANTKAKIAQLDQALKGAEKDNTRLETEIAEYKTTAKQLPTCLAELNETNKQLAALREKYNQTEQVLNTLQAEQKGR